MLDLKNHEELSEALLWLKNQKSPLSQMVSDSSIALKMYKKHKEEKKESLFGAGLKKIDPIKEKDLSSSLLKKENLNLDEKSLEAIKKTKDLLNLNSDDALRALIRLGFSKLKKLEN